jgi:predicted PurR-regulated permease PerM
VLSASERFLLEVLSVAKVSAAPGWQRALVILSGTVVGVVVVVCLYWARVVFIPVALAVFLTFLLAPLVLSLQRRGLGRVPSVILVVLAAALLLGGTGWVVVRQMTSLAAQLPQYTDNIKGKVQSLQALGQRVGGARFHQMIRDLGGASNAKPAEPGEVPSEGTTAPPQKPPSVVVEPQNPVWLGRLTSAVGSALEALSQAGLAIVLTIFMLLKREDLRDRFIQLAGHGRMTVTTKAVDDASTRISRYLLMQLVINSVFGLALGVGLFLIGLDYAFLWGFLAGVLRYVPYIGSPVAGLLVIALSLAQFEGWVQPLSVLGLIVVLELVTYNFLEPWLFSQSLGVSEVALLVAAAFWAFLWGPVGLVLSGPLTVCLVILGKYVPQLRSFDVLLGDEPVLGTNISYYQRLLARDQDEATQLVLAQVKISPPEHLYDELLVPALTYLKRDRERDDLTETDEQFVLRATQEILEDLGERQRTEDRAEATISETEGPAPHKILVLGCPGRDEADRLALEMLRQLLDPAKWELEVLSVEMLSAELVALAGEKKAAVVCIGALPPGGLAHARYLCKRLRVRLPAAKIVVGRWGLRGNVQQNQEQLREAGADQVETTLLETRDHLNAWLPVLAHQELKAAAARDVRLVAV